MKIIGHRGAAGLVDENTIESIQAAISIGTKAIEYDIHLLGDGSIILLHDSNFKSTTGMDLEIDSANLSKVNKLRTANGYRIPTFEKVLGSFAGTTMFIEPKNHFPPSMLVNIIEKAKLSDFKITSRQHDLLLELQKMRPKWQFYPSTDKNVFELIKFASSNKMTGISIHHHLLNPFSFFIAKRKKLDIAVFTVNSYWHMILCWLLGADYIFTDRPDRAKKLGFIRRR